MLGRKQIIFLFVLAAIVSPFVFYSSPMKPWISSGGGGTIVQEFIYPFEYVWHRIHSGVRGGVNRYINLIDAADEAKVLREQLAMIQVRIIDYESQVQEVKRLRELLGFKKIDDIETVTAEVLGSKGIAPFKTIRIARGKMDDLKIGQPVVSPAGVVGKILRTGLKYSDVLLLEDSNFNLDVIVERTRTRGIIQGISGNLCRLKLHKRADIKIGDTLITSGFVGGFPKGIPVGKVTKISFKSDNVTQEITVEPWVDYIRLEEVMVLKSTDREAQDIEETAGFQWIDSATRKTGG